MDMRRLVGRNLARVLPRSERARRNPTVITVCELALVLCVSHLDLLRSGGGGYFFCHTLCRTMIARTS